MFANKTHQLAEKALKEGKIEKAIALYTEALLENPDHCDIISDRGVAYLHLNNKVKCFEDLNRAIELQPNYSFRFACRAYAKNNFGDIDGAIEDYTIAVELDPDDAIAHNNLGLLLEQKGYQSEAKERFALADQLSQQEDNLLNVIDEMETGLPGTHNERSSSKKEEEKELDSKWEATKKELKKIFTSKKQFNEFMDFIKNGFKTK
jgi:tetratricopeptide (TPR) repeat protein